MKWFILAESLSIAATAILLWWESITRDDWDEDGDA